MNWGTIRALVTLELRSLVRDRRTVVMSIVLPVLTMPVFMFASSAIERRRQEAIESETMVVAVAPDAPPWVAALAKAAVDGAANAPPDATNPDVERHVAVRLTVTPDPKTALGAGAIGAYATLAPPERADALARADTDALPPPPTAEGEPPARAGAAPVVAVYFRSNDTRSRLAADAFVAAMRAERDRAREQALAAAGPALRLGDVASFDTTSVADAAAETGSRAGRFLTALVIFMMIAGGGTVASDTISGEKERGTLETLLTTSAARADIVAAKVVTIFLATAVIVSLQLGSIVAYSALKVLDLPADISRLATPGTVALLALLYVPVAALVSSTLLLVSAKARSYKEAQQFFLPMMLCGAALGLAALLPGLSARSAISAVPVSGIAVAVRDTLAGRPDWLMAALAIATTLGTAVLVLRRVVVVLSSEGAVSAATEESTRARTGLPLFEHRVGRWFALMWVAIFVASTYFGTTDIRVQVSFNLLVVFLGGTLLMIRTYGLDARSTLSLRAPHPMAWVAVLIGAPSGLLVALGVSRLANLVLPVPAELLEDFGKSLFPDDIPVWQMLIFVAVLPGICEELAFRGVLLAGLRRRMGTLKLCLTIGIVFGMFHFALFRLASTAALGAGLAVVTVLSGSIYPAMVWHALNNGISIVAAYSGLESAGEAPWWVPAVAAVPLALSFAILARWRRRDIPSA